jgi:hypothetical protein
LTGKLRLLEGEPPPTGDEQWDALLAALAEHLAAQLDQAPPAWSRSRGARRAVVSLVVAVQAHGGPGLGAGGLRKHGVHLSARDLEAA